MEPEEQIYVNIEELGYCNATYQEPEETGTKPVSADAVAREETETWSPFKVATVCLGLLCFLLLTTVVGVRVLYARDFNQLTRDFNQLTRDLANHTAEKHQLLVRYQNLTAERDQLQTSLESAVVELKKVTKTIGTCPAGWRQFGCSCYSLSTTRTTWETSRQTCINQGAVLVIIDSREEMVFLNKLGDHLRFWIGLSKSSYFWAWTDGRSLSTSYWRNSWHTLHQTQNCVAFNSFHSQWTIKSWSQENCDQVLHYVCEKQAVSL